MLSLYPQPKKKDGGPFMNNPIIAANKPLKTTLKSGEDYYYCSCGKSGNQPFCDGSHKGSSFKPLKFTAEKSDDAFLCRCKQTSNPPYCDGSHRKFDDTQVGKEGPSLTKDTSAMPPAEPTPEEPTVSFIHQLARDGLSKSHHGPMGAMGVPRNKLPHWDDIQIMVAQLAKAPLQEDVPVQTALTIGPKAKKPLHLDLPIFVSDMSFGALSEEAKTAMAKGAELAGTGICSGEGGMLPEEQQANNRYFYEYASAGFGYNEDLLTRVQAFHFKAGQGAKTGTGGHLPGNKVTEKIAEVRNLEVGQNAVSPPTFKDLSTPKSFANFSDRVRDITGGIPVGFKMSANHIEQDLAFALEAGADYVILDGRGGGTGAAPLLFRDHISVPTLPALARARRFLDQQGASGRVTLIVTGGLRVPSDFIKALALGADGIAIANSAMQSIGCVAARICNTNNCPAGIATQKKDLRQKLNIDNAAQQLSNFLLASTELMSVMARACGHTALSQFNINDLGTYHKDLADMTDIAYTGCSRQITTPSYAINQQT
ncbi:MAG: glutamate synthase domain-containing protein 2/CDGSH-type Zn-finger protein [Candidatus Marinamargulisbacteria bacterium]|jgi:glutamate synthase domain-containing protein 2/CDGSH-type Zn-finger protein